MLGMGKSSDPVEPSITNSPALLTIMEWGWSGEPPPMYVEYNRAEPFALNLVKPMSMRE